MNYSNFVRNLNDCVLLLFVSILLTGTGCSTIGQDGIFSKEEMTHIQTGCSSGGTLGCYLLGEDLLARNQPEAAKPNLEIACNAGWAHACTTLSTLQYKPPFDDQAGAIASAKSGCDGGDPVGCYNYACYLCDFRKSEKGSIDQALTALDDAYVLGFSNADHAKSDPQLQCLARVPRFHQWLSKVKNRNDGRLTEFTHRRFPQIAASIIIPNLKEKFFGNPLVFRDGPTVNLTYFGTSQSVDAAIQNIDPKAEMIEERTSTRNGFKILTREYRLRNSGFDATLIITVTGDHRYSVVGTGFFLNSFADTIGKTIRNSLEEVTFDPRSIPGIETFAFMGDFKKLKLKYAGETMGQLHFNEAGKIVGPKGSIPQIIIEPQISPHLEFENLNASIKTALEGTMRNAFSPEDPPTPEPIQTIKRNDRQIWSQTFSGTLKSGEKVRLTETWLQIQTNSASKKVLLHLISIERPLMNPAPRDQILNDSIKQFLFSAKIRPDLEKTLDKAPLRPSGGPDDNEPTGTGLNPVSVRPTKWRTDRAPFLTKKGNHTKYKAL